MKKRMIIILCALTALFIMTGAVLPVGSPEFDINFLAFGFGGDVELKIDYKLIDLEKALQEPDIGQSGNPDENDSRNPDAADPNDNSDKTNVGTETGGVDGDGDNQEKVDISSDTDPASLIKVRIREKRIFYDGAEGMVTEPQKALEDLLGMHGKYLQIELVDDYAEYHTFADMKQLLEDKRIAYKETEIY